MRPHDDAYLLTLRMYALDHWPFMIFFKEVPTLDDAIPLLASHPLPYAMAIDTRTRGIELLRKHSLPDFDARFAACRIVLHDEGTEVGLVEIRQIPIHDNSSKAKSRTPVEQKKPAANLLVRKLLPILNRYGIPAPVEDDAWQKVPEQATNGMYGAVFTKKPWIGPHHLQVAAFANSESGNVVVSLKLCDPAGYADGSFIYLSTGEKLLLDSTKKRFLPMIQDLRRRFPQDELPEGFGFRREVGRDGKILAPTPENPAVDVTHDPRKQYSIKFDAIRLFGSTDIAIPPTWMPPDTTIIRSKTGSRFITVQVFSLEPSPEAFESKIKQHLARVPLHAERGVFAPAAIVSIQGLSAPPVPRPER